MKKNRLIIGISALALCVCASAVLVIVLFNPFTDNASETGPASESYSVSTEPEPGDSAEVPDASQDATVLPNSVTGTGGVPAAPAPMDLVQDSVTALVNRDYKLTEDYIPADLVVPDVRFTFSYYDDKKLMRAEAAAALEELFAAGDSEGIRLYGVSAYRSYTRQYTIYATNLITKGVTHTNRYSAAPGASEHQTGLVIDVTSDSAGQSLEEVFGTTEEGIWLAENASRFGFIIRYPKDLEDLTGYYYEPWHIRYVGKPLAAYLDENDLTLDEYYGYEPSVPFSSLADTPLIDTESERYLSLYRSLKEPTPAPSRPSGNTAGTKTDEPETETEPSSETPSDATSDQTQETTGNPETEEPETPADTTEPADSGEVTEPPEPESDSETAGSSEATEPAEPSEPAGNQEPTAPSESAGNQEPTAPSESAGNQEPAAPSESAGNQQPAAPSEPAEASESGGTN